MQKSIASLYVSNEQLEFEVENTACLYQHQKIKCILCVCITQKEMATHSSILAWKIPWTEESDRLQSMGLQRVGHDLATKPPPCVYQSLATPWVVSCLCPWDSPGKNTLPFPSPGDLSNPGIEPGCPALQADSLPSEPLEKLPPLPHPGLQEKN